MSEQNAFEKNEQLEIPEVKVQVVNPVLDADIERITSSIEALKKLGLHRTAEYNQRKLDRLLALRDQEASEG